MNWVFSLFHGLLSMSCPVLSSEEASALFWTQVGWIVKKKLYTCGIYVILITFFVYWFWFPIFTPNFLSWRSFVFNSISSAAMSSYGSLRTNNSAKKRSHNEDIAAEDVLLYKKDLGTRHLKSENDVHFLAYIWSHGLRLKSLMLDRRCHQFLSGFLVKDHVSRHVRSIMIRVIMIWSRGFCQISSNLPYGWGKPRKSLARRQNEKGCATCHCLKCGPLSANEGGRIAQHNDICLLSVEQWAATKKM